MSVSLSRSQPAIYFCLLVATLSIAGCATHREMYLEQGATLRQGPIPGTKHTASVYILRSRVWFQPILLTADSPFAYGMNNRLITLLPMGSYVHLQVPPGSHNFTKLGVVKNAFVRGGIAREDLRVVLEVGKTYFVATQPGLMGPTFDLVDATLGTEILKEAVLARVIYAPATVDEFIQRIVNARGNTPGPQPPGRETRIEEFLPSKAQINSFFEVVAMVALVALLVMSAGAVAASNQSAITSPPVFSPPAIYSNSGRRPQVTQDGAETKVRNLDSGVTYTLRGNSIIGTDGSRYRISGNNVISATGEYYQKIGNQIYGNDGSSCMIVGSMLHCKMR